MSEPCPECKGKCCRDYYLYRIVHMGAEHYEHDCTACDDGTKYVPRRTPEDERADVLAFLRGALAEAETTYGADHLEYVIAIVEQGRHVGMSKREGLPTGKG